MARRPGRKQDDIVNNFSSDVDELLDDFDDDIELDKPLSPKEYTSYRSKSKPKTPPEEYNVNEHENNTQQENANTGNRPNSRPSNRPSNRPSSRPGVVRNNSGSNNGNKGKGIIMAIVAVLVIALAAVFLIKGNKSNKDEDANGTKQEQTNNEEYQSVGQVDKEVNNESGSDENEDTETPKPPVVPEASMEDTNSINPGLPNTTNGKNKVNGGDLTDTSEFLTDINGNPIPENYEVKQIKNETDFVNYEKRRGVTGEGMELLWLDAEYKGIPYTVQVPFKIWKELDPKGITVVSMEVLYLEGDYKVISHMQVKENYKELLEKNR